MSYKLANLGVYALLALAPYRVSAQNPQSQGEDAAAALKRQLGSDEVKLEYQAKLGYLSSVLKRFGIDPEGL